MGKFIKYDLFFTKRVIDAKKICICGQSTWWLDHG